LKISETRGSDFSGAFQFAKCSKEFSTQERFGIQRKNMTGVFFEKEIKKKVSDSRKTPIKKQMKG